MGTTTYLLDKDFLRELDLSRNRILYARIISLTFDEEQIEEIQGQVTGGSINIEGSSAVRRTCSLSMVAKNVNIHDIYWGLNTKFKLELGIENQINSRYPEIIWIPQGVYLITSFSQNLQANSYTINIGGKDKMVLLNGEIGGTINAHTWDFGTKDYVDSDGRITNKDIPLQNIIRDAVHEFAKEKYENIIIDDLKDGIELMEYRSDHPMYVLINSVLRESSNMTFDENQKCYIEETGQQTSLKNIPIYDPCIHLDLSGVTPQRPTLIKLDLNSPIAYTVAKMEYGNTVGYRQTDLTYPGDLIISVGGTVTSMLDKLVAMLGEFEYYYDVYGRFHFQRKKNWVHTTFNNITDQRDQTYVENALDTSAVTYSFENSSLISSFQNTPKLDNLRNDYSVWGTKKSSTGKELPVHLRYAISRKPCYYVNYNKEIFITEEYYRLKPGLKDRVFDWRELIYQMALDYNKHHYEDLFLHNIAINNTVDGESFYPDGITGYEQFYVDIQGFWRQLYCPERYVKWFRSSHSETPEHGFWILAEDNYVLKEEFEPDLQYYILAEDAGFYVNPGDNQYWTKDLEAPERLDFWFDFLDTDAELGKYATYAIGDRSKALNDTNVKAIYFRETPKVIFFDPKSFDQLDRLSGYTYIQCPSYFEPLFKMSSQGKSAKDVLDQNLYKHAYCIETVSLNTIPIYYLTPNTRIFVKDDITGINGDYIVNSMSIKLGVEGTMSINAVKAPERLY